MAAYPPQARAVVYDAFGGQHCDVAGHLARAVFDFWAQDLGEALAPLAEWRYEHMVPGVNIPQQLDGCHCGVFAVLFAYCLVRSPAPPATRRVAHSCPPPRAVAEH